MTFNEIMLIDIPFITFNTLIPVVFLIIFSKKLLFNKLTHFV